MYGLCSQLQLYISIGKTTIAEHKDAIHIFNEETKACLIIEGKAGDNYSVKVACYCNGGEVSIYKWQLVMCIAILYSQLIILLLQLNQNIIQNCIIIAVASISHPKEVYITTYSISFYDHSQLYNSMTQYLNIACVDFCSDLLTEA